MAYGLLQLKARNKCSSPLYFLWVTKPSNGRGRGHPRYLFRDARANRALLGGMQQGIQRSPNLSLVFESA